jgi:hypothetical protein
MRGTGQSAATGGPLWASSLSAGQHRGRQGPSLCPGRLLCKRGARCTGIRAAGIRAVGIRAAGIRAAGIHGRLLSRRPGIQDGRHPGGRRTAAGLLGRLHFGWPGGPGAACGPPRGAANTCGPSRPGTGGRAARFESGSGGQGGGRILPPRPPRAGWPLPAKWPHPPDVGGEGSGKRSFHVVSLPFPKSNLGPGHL